MKFRPPYLWFLLPVAVIAVWVMVVYLPLAGKIKDRGVELASLKQETEAVEGRIIAASEARKRDEQLKATAEQLQTRIPLLSSLPGFIREVVRTAGKDGIIVDQMRGKLQPFDTDIQSPMVHPVFEMNARGNFLQVGKCLEQLQAKEAYRRISKARISYDEKEYPTLNTAVTIEFKVWRENILENK